MREKKNAEFTPEGKGLSRFPDSSVLRYIWLSLACGFDSSLPRELTEEYDGIDGAFEEKEYKAFPHIPQKVRAALEDKSVKAAQEIYKDCRRKNIGILTLESDLYPSALKGLRNPPCVLYYRGRNINTDRELCIAVVGTRNLTEYGYAVTKRFAGELAKSGAVIVSGLARGADAAAHRACLDAGGITAAVLGTAIDRVYPAENESLFAEIEEKGIIYSEYYPGCKTGPFSFPERNRIISGLCRCTVVTEAPEGSGALITASVALSQGRDVFAVPGSIFSHNSAGTNELIRTKAECADRPAAVLERYAKYFPTKIKISSGAYSNGSPDAPKAEEGGGINAVKENRSALREISTAELSETEKKVYLYIVDNNSASSDELGEALSMPQIKLMPVLSALEICGYIKAVEGGKFIKA